MTHPSSAPPEEHNPPPPGRFSFRRSLTWTSIGVGLLLLAGLLHEVGLSTLFEGLAAADPLWMLASVAVYFVLLALGAIRWIYLARALDEGVRPLSVLHVYLTNAFMSNLTPARSGDTFAPLLLRARCGLPLAQGGAVVVLDRTADVLVLATLGVLASVSMAKPALKWESTEALVEAGRSAPAVLFLLMILGAAALFAAAILLQRRSEMHAGGKVGALVAGLERLRQSLLMLGRPRIGVGLLSLTTFSWLMHFAKNYLMINAFTPISFVDNAICQTISIAVGLLSLIPGGLGVTTMSYIVVARALGYDWRMVGVAGLTGVVLFNLIRLFIVALMLLWRR